jgi:hypothetical protein
MVCVVMKCCMLHVVIVNDVMLNVDMMNVDILSDVMLNVNVLTFVSPPLVILIGVYSNSCDEMTWFICFK